jgi:hypothetical protein
MENRAKPYEHFEVLVTLVQPSEGDKTEAIGRPTTGN